MSKKITHQKKRNTGLLYEFLVHYISEQLVQGNREKYAKAVKILKNSFRKNSELIKEFKLMRALLNASVSQHVVAEIMVEAKNIAKSIDTRKLDKEKSFLIKNINYHLNENSCFYDVDVNNYKMYATTQVLFNLWRDERADLGSVGQFSTKLVEHMTSHAPLIEKENVMGIEAESPGSTRLLMKIMSQKLNEKYNGILNNDQKSLIRAFAFSASSNDKEATLRKLVEIKQNVIKNINQYLVETNSDMLKQKLNSTRDKVLAEQVENFDEAQVIRFLSYLKLNEELSKDEDV